MDYSNICNIIGLGFDILGAFLMFWFTPKIDFNTYVFNSSEAPEFEAKARFKNNMVRFGMILLVCGFSLQGLALLLKN